MIRRAGLALVLAGLLPGCDGCTAAPDAEPPAPRAGDPLAVRHAAPITEESLRDLLAELPPNRPIGTKAHLAARTWIVDALVKDGLKAELRPFSWAGFPEGDLANIEAIVPGADARAPIVMLSAHYDSVWGTPGADDNGSGTVVLLELARRLAGGGYPHELRLLWFDAEEPGLIGSGAYVLALHDDDARRVIGLVNLETMGFTDRRPQTQRLPEGADLVFHPGDRGDFLLVLGNLKSSPLASVVSAALERERSPAFRAESFSWLSPYGLEMPDSRRSDHAPFWDRGLPAVVLTDTANMRSPHYHTSSDTVDTLDLPFLAAAARGVERAARVLLRAAP